MEKKFLACLLALCMLLTMAPIAAADANESPFTDVTAEDWFYDAVLYVQSEGICQGTSETTFSPNEVTTRGMIVTILWRMAGSPIAEGTQFDDVATNQYYADAILWAAANEIVTGYGDGAFGPNDAITREQLATILYRYAAYAGEDVTGEGDLSAFSDAGSVSAYAAEALVWANAQGLITGMDDGKLAPQGGATRAQVAMILYRMADAEPAPEETPGAEETVTYTVTFDWNYSNKGTYETAEVAEGEAVAVPEIPTRDGYSFLGWYTTADGTTEYAFSAAVTEDITLYAHWSKDAEPPYTEGVIHLHKYSEYIESTDGGVTHTRTCSCGRVLVDDCTYGEAVSNEDGTHSQTCADCGYVVTEDCTLAADAACPACGYTDGSYHISDAATLVAWANAINAGETFEGETIVLSGDVDLTDAAWAPIGDGTRDGSTYTGNAFKGTFDGNGYTMSGLTVPLFGIVDGATIKNVTVNSTISEEGENAILAVRTFGTTQIENVTVQGSVTNTATSGTDGAAAFVLQAFDTLSIKDSVNEATVISDDRKAAGFICSTGNAANVTIVDSDNKGDITANGGPETYAGGYIAWNGTGGLTVTIEDCTNSGDITATRTVTGGSTVAAGGFIGVCWAFADPIPVTTLTNVVNTGDVTAVNTIDAHNAYAGGVVGLLNPRSATTVSNADIDGTIIARIDNAENTTGFTAAGAIAGNMNGASTISLNIMTADTTDTTLVAEGNADEFTGAVAGRASNSYVNYNDVAITDGVAAFGDTPANATADVAAIIDGKGYTSLAEAFAAAEDDDVIQLAANTTYESFHRMFKHEFTAKNVTLLGAEGTVLNGLTFYDAGADNQENSVVVDGLTIQNITFAGSLSLETFVMKNITVENCDFINDARIMQGNVAEHVENLVVKDCDFTGSDAEPNNLTAIMLENYTNLTVTGCTFTDIDYNAMQLNHGNGGTVVITDNDFGGTGSRVLYFVGSEAFASVTISGNYFADPSAVSGKEDGNYIKSNVAMAIGENEYETDPNTNLGLYFVNVIAPVDGVYQVNNGADMELALTTGSDVTLTDDVATTTTAMGYGCADIIQNGGVLDGDGKTLSVGGSGDYSAIVTAGGTIQNLAIDNGFRAIFLQDLTEDMVLTDVKSGGAGVAYALNTGTMIYGAYSLIATGCTFNGWSSFAELEDASFTECDFGQGTYYGADSVYGRVVKPYVTTTFKDCTFAQGYYIDLSVLGCDGEGVVIDEDATITLENCKVGDTVITADNYTELLDAIELPEGKTLADCVIFK